MPPISLTFSSDDSEIRSFLSPHSCLSAQVPLVWLLGICRNPYWPQLSASSFNSRGILCSITPPTVWLWECPSSTQGPHVLPSAPASKPSLEVSCKLTLPVSPHSPLLHARNMKFARCCFSTVLHTSLLTFAYSTLPDSTSLLVQIPHTRFFAAQLKSSPFQEAGPNSNHRLVFLELEQTSQSPLKDSEPQIS